MRLSLFPKVAAALLLFLVAWGRLMAQPAGGTASLKVKKVLPGNSATLKLSEKVFIQTEYSHNSENPVGVSTILYFKGAIVRSTVTNGSQDLPKGTGITENWCRSDAAALADEIRVSMWDKVTKKEVTGIKVPVRLIWEDGPAVPGQVQKDPKQQQGMMRLELNGYEVPQDVASALFLLPMPELNPEKMIAKISPLIAKGAVRLVKLHTLEVPANGGRGTAPEMEGYSLGFIVTPSSGNFASVTYALRNKALAGTTNEVLARLGRAVFLTTLPGSASDKVLLVFAKVSRF